MRVPCGYLLLDSSSMFIHHEVSEFYCSGFRKGRDCFDKKINMPIQALIDHLWPKMRWSSHIREQHLPKYKGIKGFTWHYLSKSEVFTISFRLNESVCKYFFMVPSPMFLYRFALRAQLTYHLFVVEQLGEAMVHQSVLYTSVSQHGV